MDHDLMNKAIGAMTLNDLMWIGMWIGGGLIVGSLGGWLLSNIIALWWESLAPTPAPTPAPPPEPPTWRDWAVLAGAGVFIVGGFGVAILERLTQ